MYQHFSDLLSGEAQIDPNTDSTPDIDDPKDFLHILYNQLLNKGEYPDSWATGYIIPIHKGGEKNDAKN